MPAEVEDKDTERPLKLIGAGVEEPQRGFWKSASGDSYRGYPGHLKSQWQCVEPERDACSPAYLTSALSDHSKGSVSITRLTGDSTALYTRPTRESPVYTAFFKFLFLKKYGVCVGSCIYARESPQRPEEDMGFPPPRDSQPLQGPVRAARTPDRETILLLLQK